VSDLAYASLAELGRQVRARALSPVTLLEAILDRIERCRALNAFITVTAEEARTQATQAEREIATGRYRGPLHGIPISLKDLIDTEGVRTTCGSRIFADRVPAHDATVAARLRAAGAILLGKANLHEFAFGVTTNNPHFGPARNPWRPDRIPGGSSGGSGAAVAAGCGPVSIGTDTGGSIRIPAALCGVVGLKPTYGRVSRYGVLPLSWTLDHIGPLTRTVEDAALVLQAIAGPDPRDPTTLGQAVPEFTGGLGRLPAGARLGVVADEYHSEMAPDVRSEFRAALEVLAGLGLELEDVEFPHPSEARTAAATVLFAEASSVHERWLPDRAGEYGADTLALIRQGAFLTAAQYLRAQRVRALILREAGALLERVTALVLPTLPVVAPEIGQTAVSLGGRPTDVRAALTRFVRNINFMGYPAISVPCGFGADGLPVGLQIIGRANDEPTVLAIAHAYEQGTPWHTRRPPEP